MEEEAVNSMVARDKVVGNHKQLGQETSSLCHWGSCLSMRSWQWSAEIGTLLRGVQTWGASSSTSAASTRAVAGCALGTTTMP